MQEFTAVAGVVSAVFLGTGLALAFRLVELHKRSPSVTEHPAPLGRVATAVGHFAPRGGHVEIDGARWRAITSAIGPRIEDGMPVTVVGHRTAFTLVVEPIHLPPPAPVVQFPHVRTPPPGNRRAA